jgi:Uma2 family endonuclease
MATRQPESEFERTLLELLPPQGRWDDEGYLWLNERTARLLELADGRIEIVPMPTDEHQGILQTLFLALLDYARAHGGKVHFAPLRLHIRAGKFREPDLLLLRDAADPRRGNRFWSGADLVLKVVSPDGAERDPTDKVFDYAGRELTHKIVDYAEAGVPEYWIVEPTGGTITVLRLNGDRYATHGVFGRGMTATAATLPGFAIPVDAALDAR